MKQQKQTNIETNSYGQKKKLSKTRQYKSNMEPLKRKRSRSLVKILYYCQSQEKTCDISFFLSALSLKTNQVLDTGSAAVGRRN